MHALRALTRIYKKRGTLAEKKENTNRCNENVKTMKNNLPESVKHSKWRTIFATSARPCDNHVSRFAPQDTCRLSPSNNTLAGMRLSGLISQRLKGITMRCVMPTQRLEGSK